MKKMLTVAMAAVVAMVAIGVKAMSLADALKRCDEAVDSPEAVTEIMKDLSAEDQKAFVAALNVAISKLPGSAEEKAAKYVVANEAAFKSAAKGNLPGVVAETFATVPPEALAGLSERFATDVFNRDTDKTVKYTDERFVAIAKSTVQKIVDRNEGNVDAGVRDALAAIMFERAANVAPANLRTELVNLLPENVRDLAKSEWIPQALGDGGQEPSYASLLAATSNESVEPDEKVVNVLSGVQPMVALLADLEHAPKDVGPLYFTEQLFGHNLNNDAYGYAGEDIGMARIPRTMDPKAKFNPKYKRGEPEPYYGQEFYRKRPVSRK